MVRPHRRGVDDGLSEEPRLRERPVRRDPRESGRERPVRRDPQNFHVAPAASPRPRPPSVRYEGAFGLAAPAFDEAAEDRLVGYAVADDCEEAHGRRRGPHLLGGAGGPQIDDGHAARAVLGRARRAGGRRPQRALHRDVVGEGGHDFCVVIYGWPV